MHPVWFPPGSFPALKSIAYLYKQREQRSVCDMCGGSLKVLHKYITNLTFTASQRCESTVWFYLSTYVLFNAITKLSCQKKNLRMLSSCFLVYCDAFGALISSKHIGALPNYCRLVSWEIRYIVLHGPMQ